MALNDDLLAWLGNVLNFAILIFIINGTIGTGCFSFSDSLISAAGLFASILIHLYTSSSSLSE